MQKDTWEYYDDEAYAMQASQKMFGNYKDWCFFKFLKITLQYEEFSGVEKVKIDCSKLITMELVQIYLVFEK